jgi:hypothetical protein
LKNITCSRKPNPQGKGLSPVLQELENRKLGVQKVESISFIKILEDYAISRFVLCAEFNFKPVFNKPYFLYVRDEVLKLSLIAPDQWGKVQFGTYICQCSLELPLHWRITHQNTSKRATKDIAVALSRLKDTLLSDFFSDQPLKFTLPFCDDRLPFHRRVLANALASQVKYLLPQKLTCSFKQLAEENIGEKNSIPFLGKQ